MIAPVLTMIGGKIAHEVAGRFAKGHADRMENMNFSMTPRVPHSRRNLKTGEVRYFDAQGNQIDKPKRKTRRQQVRETMASEKRRQKQLREYGDSGFQSRNE